MWFTSRMEVTSTELCFYYSSGERTQSSAAPHMQLEIFWVTPHTAWSPSLLDLFSFSILLFLQYTLPLSLSVNPCGLLHTYSQNQLLATIN